MRPRIKTSRKEDHLASAKKEVWSQVGLLKDMQRFTLLWTLPVAARILRCKDLNRRETQTENCSD
jgi:hypothetical protein